MRFGVIIAAICAIALHAGIILFGGLLVPQAQKDQGAKKPVEILNADLVKKDVPKEPEKPEEKPEKQEEPPPDAEKVSKNMETPDDSPRALEMVDLSALASALNGSGGGEFGNALGDFSSGGQVGGTGTGKGMSAQSTDATLSFDDIDQKPRAMFQTQPAYPAEMRGKKVTGVVTVLFIVDPAGKVTKQRIEKSSNAAFEKPALDAVKQWKFEPAVKGGQRVACKMRQTLRFPPS